MEQQISNLYQLLEQAAKISTDGIIIYRPGNVEEYGQFIAYRSLFRQAKLDATKAYKGSIQRIPCCCFISTSMGRTLDVSGLL